MITEFRKNNKDLFDLCVCGHTQIKHKDMSLEENAKMPIYKNQKDKNCKCNNCDCKKYISKK